MGKIFSSPVESPPPPLLAEPWRKFCWEEREVNLQYVQEYKPEVGNIKHLRVLMYGPTGVGKSSFINSVSSVLNERMVYPAAASATTSDRSFTIKYQTHILRKGKGSSAQIFPVVFTDTMGLEEVPDFGINPDDIKLAMKGHVKEGHKFNPVAPLSEEDPGYNPNPSPNDKVHVLVCVYSANTPDINHSLLKKMCRIRQMAKNLGIPHMAIITKIDEACPETEKDIKNVYKSRYVKKTMERFSSTMGIPMNLIYPLKTYSNEICMNKDVDILILSALRSIIDIGNDHFQETVNI